MLKFHGIQLYQGKPERFEIEYHLLDSLQIALNTYQRCNENCSQAIQFLQNLIEECYAKTKQFKSQKAFNFNIAVKLRAKDILEFFGRFQELTVYKIQIATILKQPLSISQKWNKIHTKLIENSKQWFGSEPLDEILSDPNSEISLILQMVILFFLEQDEELPPANLKCHFIPRKFPSYVFESTKSIYDTSSLWNPKNQFCRQSYLSHQLLIQHQLKQLSIYKYNSPENNPSEETKSISTQWDTIQFKYHTSEENTHEQLSLLPETPAETLIAFQRMIQKKYSFEGVRHFLLILRQIAGSIEYGNIFWFSLEKHLKILNKLKSSVVSIKKQSDLCLKILQEIQSLEVIRTSTTKNSNKKRTNFFIQELERESTQIDKSPKKNNSYIQIKLLLDSFFLPSTNNPFCIGTSLLFIPDTAFQENIRKHSLLSPLLAYLLGVSFSEFRIKNGTVQKTAFQILEGCAFNFSKSSKYRMIYKLKSELSFMESKKYIDTYKLMQSDKKDPFQDTYHIVTSNESILKMKNFYNKNLLNSKTNVIHNS